MTKMTLIFSFVLCSKEHLYLFFKDLESFIVEVITLIDIQRCKCGYKRGTIILKFYNSCRRGACMRAKEICCLLQSQPEGAGLR